MAGRRVLQRQGAHVFGTFWRMVGFIASLIPVSLAGNFLGRWIAPAPENVGMFRGLGSVLERASTLGYISNFGSYRSVSAVKKSSGRLEQPKDYAQQKDERDTEGHHSPRRGEGHIGSLSAPYFSSDAIVTSVAHLLFRELLPGLSSAGACAQRDERAPIDRREHQ